MASSKEAHGRDELQRQADAIYKRDRVQELSALDQGVIDQLGPMGRVLVGLDPPAQLDPKLVSARIRAAVLTAQTPEEMFAAGQATPVEELFGVPLEVQSAHLLPSQFEDGESPVFMVLDVIRLDTGDRIVVTTSAQNLMDAVAVASDRGWVAFKFKVRRAERASQAGYFPYVVESI